MSGDKKSWKKMGEYNKQDVVLLEKVYFKMLPFMTQHPNLALMTGQKEACPNCGSVHIIRRGHQFSQTVKYQRWQCMDCGSWHQNPINGGQIK